MKSTEKQLIHGKKKTPEVGQKKAKKWPKLAKMAKIGKSGQKVIWNCQEQPKQPKVAMLTALMMQIDRAKGEE